jgi:transcriptional regulator with GAF, ATPase, and Fis domain
MGETGVGKDVIANAIHFLSPRRDKPLIAVNSGAIPDSLMDSELFGHEKGAFTGAQSRKRGRFERAHSGSIFLDEIGELPTQAQIRLLRVVQNREIERVGGTETIPIDVRIIAATHRSLEKMAVEGRFREDLLFRLNVFPIVIPPLRARTEDIPALVHHFIETKSRQLRLPPGIQCAPGEIDSLMVYHWPGNVRELENLVERALILHPQGPLVFSLKSTQNDDQNEHTRASHAARSHSGKTKLNDVIDQHIRHILETTNGKIQGKEGAAAILDVHPSTLRNKLKKLGIPYGRKRGGTKRSK